MLSLSTVMVHSEQPEQLAAFYRQALGDPGFEGGSDTGWKVGGGYFMVGAHSEISGSAAEPARVITNFETADVPAEFERLRAAGATVIAEPYNPGEAPDMMLATLADPDGNYLQLATPTPDDMM